MSTKQAAQQSPDVAEAQRLERRRQIRLALAEEELRERRRAELREVIAGLDGRADAEAGKHAEACEPLQAELAEIEARIMSRIADRGPADPADEKRRAELLAEVCASNEKLQREIVLIDALKKTQRQELGKLAHRPGERTPMVENLSRPGVARVDLLDAAEVAKSADNWADQRVRAAERAVREVGEYLATVEADPAHHASDAREIYGSRLRRWRLELAAAQEALEAARAARDAAWQAILDE